MINIYDRKNKKLITEEQYASSILNFLYNNVVGRILLKTLILPFISKIYGIYQTSFLSKKHIKGFVKQYQIDESKYEETNYKSFNDFFTRKLKKENLPKKQKNNIVISPAESKLLVYKITKDLKVNIKGSTYTLEELTKEKVSKDYINGNCLIFRLSVNNYHRYCHIDNGELIKTKLIKGKLHTVSSISQNYKIYKENKRVVSILKTENLDEIIYIEVGALLVGDIKNYNQEKFKKGEEKGYFNVGGSTIVILTKNNIKIDKDIIKYSNEGIETLLEYGERIGETKC